MKVVFIPWTNVLNFKNLNNYTLFGQTYERLGMHVSFFIYPYVLLICCFIYLIKKYISLSDICLTVHH